MRILGIDPGYDRCGVALLLHENGRDTLVESTCITTARGDDFSLRLTKVVNEVSAYLDRCLPDCVAIETLYVTNNQKTAMRVAEVRGALLYVAACRNVRVIELNPRTVKQSVLADGRGDKRQMVQMVRRLVVMDDRVRLDDEYDAIGIALAATQLARG